MAVRIFEYDAQIALRDGNVVGDTLTVRFPHSAIMYLRSHKSTPDQLYIRLIAPDGQEMKYAIPTLKVVRYSIEDIFAKNLLFLIPFYIFTHETELKKMNDNQAQLDILMKEYKEIADRLNQLAEAGRITEYTKKTIMEMSGRVVDLIAMKYERVKEEVKRFMSGKILDFEAKRINDSAEARGIEIGEARGEARGETKASGLMAKLAMLLARDGRIEEIERAGTDEVYRNMLYKEYQLA